MTTPWTDERVEQLRQLWEEGFSCSRIAEVMDCGFTRNAIIGKVHRLKLEGRQRGPAKALPDAPKRERKYSDADIGTHHKIKRVRRVGLLRAQSPSIVPASEPRSLLELGAHDCRWPLGDPTEPDFMFCGAPAAAGFPYCVGHCAMAYIAPHRIQEKGRAAKLFAEAVA